MKKNNFITFLFGVSIFYPSFAMEGRDEPKLLPKIAKREREVESDDVKKKPKHASENSTALESNLDAQALFEMGMKHEWGHKEITRDLAKASKYYSLAYQKGYIKAGVSFSDLLVDYKNPIPWAEIKRFLMSVKKANEVGAFSRLGRMYQNGEGRGEGDGDLYKISVAKQYYEYAAGYGDGRALSNLGLLYLIGNGVKKDRNVAEEYFLKSAQKGDVRGLCHYIKLLLDRPISYAGYYPQKTFVNADSLAKAINLFNETFKMENFKLNRPKEFLLFFEIHGTIVESYKELFEQENAPENIFSYDLSLNKDVLNAIGETFDMEIVYNAAKSLDKQGQFAQALQLFKYSADRGWILSMKNLSRMYHLGNGVEKNADMANHWSQMAKNKQSQSNGKTVIINN